MKTIHCMLNCEGRPCPSLSDVERMYSALDDHASRKGYGQAVDERQFWGPPPFSEKPMLFAIYRDFE